MARPRERVRGLGPPDVVSGRGTGPVGGGFGGGGGGLGADLTPEPFGLPPDLIGQLEGLDAAVAGQVEADYGQNAAGGPYNARALPPGRRTSQHPARHG